MALDNRFRFDELVKQGSKAIVSEDPISKTHTFIDGGTTIVSASKEVPYEYIQGERDGEIANYIEKPAYTEEELIKAVDVNIDELVKPPKEPKPDVVPRPVYDELEDRFQQALDDLERAQSRILELEGQIAQLNAELQAALVENDSLKVQKAVVDNQYQQIYFQTWFGSTLHQASKFVDVTQTLNLPLHSEIWGKHMESVIFSPELLPQHKS